MDIEVLQQPLCCNGASVLQQVLTDSKCSSVEQAASEGGVDESAQMTIVSDNYGCEGVCPAKYIDLNGVDESLKTMELVKGFTDSDPKVEESGRLFETEQEEMISEESSPDQGSDINSLERLEDDLMRSSQESLSNPDAKIVNGNAHVSSKDSEVEALRESAGKRGRNAGLLNGVSSVRVNQKPRSVRGINGTRKSTWGSTTVLQRVASDSLEGKVRRKSLDQPRASRQARKRRHNDMAYEGDMEWEAVVGGGEITTVDSTTGEKVFLGKSRAQAALGSILFAQVLTGDSAAVTAGLQARAPSPAERIRFKDILKRRGGLQEYLECRYLPSFLEIMPLSKTWGCLVVFRPPLSCFKRLPPKNLDMVLSCRCCKLKLENSDHTAERDKGW